MTTQPRRTEGSAAPWHRGHLVVLGIAAVVAAWLGWMARTRELLVLGDEPVYLSLSHSLASGRYHDEFLAGTPWHAHYPPGMSLWLLAVRTVAGAEPDVARAANFLLLALTAVLVADLTRRLSTPWTGVLAGVLTALSPMLVTRAGTLYAETLFMTLTVLALWAAYRADESGRRRWRLLAIGAGVAGFLTRVAGIAALGGLWLWSVWRRQWGTVIAGGLAMGTVVAAWVGYSIWAATDSISRSYASDFSATINVTLASEVLRMVDNVRYYLTSGLPTALGVPSIPGTPIDNLAMSAILGGLGLAGLLVVMRRAPATGLTLLAYAVLLSHWTWPNERFVVPMLPVILLVLAVGAHWVGSKLAPRLVALPSLVLVALVGVPGASAAVAEVRSTDDCTEARRSDATACYPLAHRGYVAALQAADGLLPPAAIIAGGSPAMIHYLGRRQALPFSFSEAKDGGIDLDRLRERGATHLIVGPARWQRSGRAGSGEAGLRHTCESLVPVVVRTGSVLFGIGHPTGQGGSGEGCVALEGYLDQVRELSEPPTPALP